MSGEPRKAGKILSCAEQLDPSQEAMTSIQGWVPVYPEPLLPMNADSIDLSQLQLGIACPMANENKSACKFVEQVLARCDGFRAVRFFAVLDRTTKDNTRELLELFAAQEARLRVIWAPENKCVVDAYFRGYQEALAWGADWILEIDAGFSHQPDEIPQFFSMMSKGYDCVFGSRMMKGGSIVTSSPKRHFVSWGGTVLTNLLLGTTLTDMTSGFELFSRDALQMVIEKGIKSRAHFFQTEIKVHCRQLRIVEVPITYKTASARLNTTAIVEAFYHLAKLFTLRCKGVL
jgi:dolichol-phosphate mannosyltransferase